MKLSKGILKKQFRKLNDLEYYELEVEKYLVDEKLSYEEKKILFQFRTRMSKFGRNFKSGRELIICPLCNIHFDDQSLCLKCPVVRKKLGCNINIDDLMTKNISVKTAKVLVDVMKIRNNLTNLN